MKALRMAVIVAGAISLAACSTTYKGTPQLRYYHGQNVPEGYIKVVRATEGEIEFQIRVEFTEKKLYHLVLDGDTPVAEGWISTLRAGGMSYNAVLRTKKGLAFEPGKTYRLCIRGQNPEAAQMTSNNYPCMADHSFVFQVK